MLKTLTIAILLGLTSGRPSVDSAPKINISELKNLNYVNHEFPNAKENFIAQLEETPDQKLPFESLLRNRRASNSSAMNDAGTSGASLPNFLQVPLQGIVSVLSTVVLTLLQTILGLVSGILNPILVLLTGLLNPVLLPLRPVLNPLLYPVNGILTDILKALNLSLSLSGLLTGNVTNSALIPSLITRAVRSVNSETSRAPRSDADGSSFTGVPNALKTLVTNLRSKRQSPGTSTGSGVGSILSSPLTLAENMITEAMNIMISPLELILSPIISLLSLPMDLISQPLDLVQWLLSNVMSFLSGILEQILPAGITSMLSPMLGNPSTPAATVPNATANPLRQRRSDTNSGLAGPLSAVLSILSSPLKTLFSYLPSLLGHFNISYSTLQEAAQALFSKAAKNFFTMACNQTKNFILPGLDDLLQSIVGSEYIPDYMNSLIAQLHTVYKLLKMMGYLRPS